MNDDYSRHYRHFDVYRSSDSQLVGSVEAQSAAQAVFRLAGGEFGRNDYFALDEAGHAKVKAMAAERAAAAKAFDAEWRPSPKCEARAYFLEQANAARANGDDDYASLMEARAAAHAVCEGA